MLIFPEVEKTVDAFFDLWKKFDSSWGENGFIDYFAGPRFAYSKKGEKYWVGLKRTSFMTYMMRPGLWLMYARSGDRKIREFAEGTNMTYMDGTLGHWESSTSSPGLIRFGYKPLPLSWGSAKFFDGGQTSSLNYCVWYYYLTSYRRARDVMNEFTESAKKRWSPAVVIQSMNAPAILWHLAQAYGVNWDPALRDIAHATMDILGDERSPIGISKYAMSYASTKKTYHHFRAFLEAWEIIGETRYYKVAKSCAQLWFKRDLNSNPYKYLAAMALEGSFLYDENPDPAVAESTYSKVRGLSADYNPKNDTFSDTRVQVAPTASFFSEIGYALHVVSKSNVDKHPVGSWIAYDDAGSETTLYLQKPEDDAVKMYYKMPGVIKGPMPTGTVNTKNIYGGDLFRIVSEIGGEVIRPLSGICGDIDLPIDMFGYTYRLDFTGKGQHYIFADRRLPLVVYAPGYWYPEPKQRPAPKYYFRTLPENKNPQIFFEGFARLYSPDGKPYKNGEKLKGWVKLPEEQAGLWAFELLEYKLVKAMNFPPFFAVRDPKSHFIPKVPWQQKQKTAKQTAFPERFNLGTWRD